MELIKGKPAKVCIERKVRVFEVADFSPGAVTDYGSSMVHWMRNRQPRYKGAPRVELERPSPSYIAQVGSNLLVPPSQVLPWTHSTTR